MANRSRERQRYERERKGGKESGTYRERAILFS